MVCGLEGSNSRSFEREPTVGAEAEAGTGQGDEGAEV